MFEIMVEAENQADEVDPDVLDGDEREAATAIYNRLMMLLGGPALTIHQTVLSENGLEVWRRLPRGTTPRRP